MPESTSTGIKKRSHQADFINIAPRAASPTYKLMGAGFTALDENPAAQTKSKKYVCDDAATGSIASYSWTAAYTADQIRSQEAVEFICGIGETQKVGIDAETDYVKVDLDKKVGSAGSVYEARKFRVAVEVASFGNDDGDMQVSGNLLGIGNPVIGKYDTAANTFTATA